MFHLSRWSLAGFTPFAVRPGPKHHPLGEVHPNARARDILVRKAFPVNNLCRPYRAFVLLVPFTQGVALGCLSPGRWPSGTSRPGKQILRGSQLTAREGEIRSP